MAYVTIVSGLLYPNANRIRIASLSASRFPRNLGGWSWMVLSMLKSNIGTLDDYERELDLKDRYGDDYLP